MKNRKVLSWPVSLLLVIHYIFGYGIGYPNLVKWLERVFHLSYDAELLLKTGIYVLVFIVTVIPAIPVLKYGWEKLTDSYGNNMKTIIGGQFLMIILLFGSAVFLNFIGLRISRNQRRVQDMILMDPFYYSVLVSVFAPFVEETVFRVCIFGRLKESRFTVLGYLISAFLFGFIHIMDSILNGYFREWPFLIPYSLLGLVLAYVYDRTDSIWCSILLHMLHNSLSLLIGV